MPIGPSHSSHSGGDGGSRHGGGGFHFGGPRHGGSGGSLIGELIGGAIVGAVSAKRRQRFFDRYGYYPDDHDYDDVPHRTKPTAFLVFALFFGFFLFVTISILSGYKNSLKTNQNAISTMESDWNEYSYLINNANTKAGYYKTTATFDSTKRYYSYSDNPTTPGAYKDFTMNTIQYYFIVYEYTDAVDGKKHIGQTYSQFSASQISNGVIEIAYYHVGNETYSINTNYNLKTCAEYTYRQNMVTDYKSSVSTMTIIVTIIGSLCALFVVLFIVKMKKYNKLVAQDDELLYQKRQAETQKAQAEASQAKEEVARKNRFCVYCGCKIDPETNACPSCGARISK